MNTNYFKNSYSAQGISLRNPGHSLINKLLPIRTVSAQFDAAIQATDKATQAMEQLAARMESR